MPPTSAHPGQHRWYHPVLLHMGVLGTCLALVAIATYPIVRQLRTHLAGPAALNDAVCFAWNNWWIHKALTELQAKPYFTDFVLFPFQIDLRLHTLGLLYGVLSVPLVPLLGPVGVVNVQLLATPVLNGYAVFLLVRKLVGRNDVAMLSAGIVAVVPAINFHIVVGRPSCSAIWPVALGLLFLHRLLDEPRWRNSLGLAVSLLALLTIDQQMPIFGGLLLFLYLLAAAITRPRDVFNRRLLLHGVAVLVLLAYPLRLLYFRPFFETPGYTVPHPSEALNYSLPPWMLVHPGHLWRLYGALLPLGLLVAIAMVRVERRSTFGIVCALVCLVFTLGPVIKGTSIPMPFGVLRALPGFAQFRTPYRFQIPAALAMVLALAPVLAYLCGRLDQRRLWRFSAAHWLLAGLGVAVATDTILHRGVYGFQTHQFPEEPIYRTIAETPGDFSVLEVPFGVQSGTTRLGRGDGLMFYQTVHGKRMLNGYLTRVPVAALDYYGKSAALRFLGNESFESGDLVRDFDAKLRELRVGFIVVHPGMLDADRFEAILGLLRQRSDLEPVATGTGTLAFRVRTRGQP